MDALFIIGIAIVAFLAIVLFNTYIIVQERTARVVQRLGQFNRVLKPGLHFLIPFLDSASKPIDLRIRQIDVQIETKTKDNVFVQIRVSVHLQVREDLVQDAYYKLSDPISQLSSYIYDDVRAEVPKMSLDDVFARKEDIAFSIQENLATQMQDYGYRIIKALITDIEPDSLVKESMNRINAARRNKEALSEDAEGRKMAKIKDAEAEKESKRLQGEGVADQRLAIIKGFADSVQDFSETLKDVSAVEIMQFVLLTQHYDTIKEIGERNSTMLVPYSPNSVSDLQQQIMQGSFMSNKMHDIQQKIEKEGHNKVSLEGMDKLEKARVQFQQKQESILDVDKDINDAFL